MEKQYNPLQNLQTTTTLDSRLTSDQNDYPMRRLSEVPVLHSQGQASDSPAGALACTMPWLEALGFSKLLPSYYGIAAGRMGMRGLQTNRHLRHMGPRQVPAIQPVVWPVFTSLLLCKKPAPLPGGLFQSAQHTVLQGHQWQQGRRGRH